MKTYTILDIAKELGTNKERIRQTLNKLEIKAVNEKTRTHNNIAKVYSVESKKRVIEELAWDLGILNAKDYAPEAKDSKEKNAKGTKDSAQETQIIEKNAADAQTRAQEAQDEIIKLLKTQLEDKDKQLDRAYQEKQDLIRSLNEAQQLVNQQQQLSLQASKKIEILELEMKETLEDEKSEEKYETKKTKWYDIFKRNKKK